MRTGAKLALFVAAVVALSGCSLPLGLIGFPFPQLRTVTLTAEHVGTLCANGVVVPGSEAVAGDYKSAGNPCGGSHAVAAFIAFRTPQEIKRQGVSLLTARLSGTRRTVSGNPYEGGRALLVEPVPYLDDGRLDGSDWPNPARPVRGLLLSEGPASPDGARFQISAATAVELQRTNVCSGFRILFVPGPEANGRDDLERIVLDTLTVEYMSGP